MSRGTDYDHADELQSQLGRKLKKGEFIHFLGESKEEQYEHAREIRREEHNEISDKKMIEVLKTYIRLYNKEPESYDELLEFRKLLSSIVKTYDVTYDQIDEDILLKYKNLINA